METRKSIAALLEAHAKAEEVHHEMYAALLKAQRVIKDPKTTQADRVDAVFLVRQVERLADDTRKEFRKTRELGERITCLVWTAQSEADAAQARSVKGRYVTATPNMRMAANLPSHKHDPEGYAAFMQSIGVDVASAAVQCGAIQLHYPGVERLITECTANAKPLPAGLPADKLIPVYSLTLRERS